MFGKVKDLVDDNDWLLALNELDAFITFHDTENRRHQHVSDAMVAAGA